MKSRLLLLLVALSLPLIACRRGAEPRPFGIKLVSPVVVVVPRAPANRPAPPVMVSVVLILATVAVSEITPPTTSAVTMSPFGPVMVCFAVQCSSEVKVPLW